MCIMQRQQHQIQHYSGVDLLPLLGIQTPSPHRSNFKGCLRTLYRLILLLCCGGHLFRWRRMWNCIRFAKVLLLLVHYHLWWIKLIKSIKYVMFWVLSNKKWINITLEIIVWPGSQGPGHHTDRLPCTTYKQVTLVIFAGAAAEKWKDSTRQAQ